MHPELGPCAATFGIINGGLNLNIVPGECYCTIDMRLTPPTTNEQSIRLVEEAIAEGCANVPGTSCTYTVLAQRPAVEKDNDSYLLKMLRAATKDVTGEEAPVDFFPGYTDTAVIAATTGNRNCMSYGPGDLFYAHKPDEFVELDDISRCPRVMTRLADSSQKRSRTSSKAAARTRSSSRQWAVTAARPPRVSAPCSPATV